MLYIYAVHYTYYTNGSRVIEKLRYSSDVNSWYGNCCTKLQMIDHIKKHPNSVKTKYYKNGSWRVGEDVRVVENSYLRTDANSIREDNLGELSEF